MCGCVNVEMGSYDNQVTVIFPWSKELMGIDRCIVDEVFDLWCLGIKTTGCCCGHNKVEAHIGVTDEFIDKMKELGYKVQHNPSRPNDEDSFVPKRL